MNCGWGGINIQSIALGKKHSRNSTDKGGLTSQVGKDLGDMLVSSAHLTFQVPSWVSLWLTALSLCSCCGSCCMWGYTQW